MREQGLWLLNTEKKKRDQSDRSVNSWITIRVSGEKTQSTEKRQST